MLSVLLTCALASAQDQNNQDNPFFKKWTAPFETPPFNEIKVEHYMPAYQEGMKQQKSAIDAIVGNKEKPTFKNTIEAMEKSGKFYSKVDYVFSSLNDAITNDSMQNLANKLAPLASKHFDDINLNPKLFARVKQLYDEKGTLNLTAEQKTVLDNYYKDFVRSGALLDEEQKAKLRKINEELSVLSLKFGQNLLKETIAIGLVIDNNNDLAGLPENVTNAAAEAAKAKGMEGKWVFTLQKPSFIPFLQYSEKRDLREKLFKGYINRGNNNNENDNKQVLARIAALRVQRANLLGYKTHADFVLERSMSKKPENVYKFLNDLWKPALKRANVEVQDMQNIIDKEGKSFKLSAWDWWYYAEKVKKAKYDLDEEMLRPYFKMENVRQGAFDVAKKLYGIQIVERNDIPAYHPDVKVYEVKEANGKHIGILYSDSD